MIRVNVIYPARQGARFDFDYYLKRHIPMVKDRLSGVGLSTITVDRGVGPMMPGADLPYACVASLQFPSSESVQQALAAHGAEILGDIQNYTDIQPVMQLGEVLL